MADEALNCFTSLLESVPGWISELEGILKTSAERQKDALSENQPTDEPQFLARKKSKSSSLRSRRSKGKTDQASKPSGSGAELLKPQLPHLTASDAFRLAQRKRKTASNCSGWNSGPVKYRSKSMVVVYYDGETQKRFETIVRSIGSSRNSLRKGKMSARVDALARSGSSGSEASSEEQDALAHIRKMNYKPARMQQSSLLSRNDGSAVFDKADDFLEKAQTLCERAAHQVLRDGDCTLEINNAKEHFADAKKLVEAELPGLRKKAEKAVERQRRDEERAKVEAEQQENERYADVTPESSNEKLKADDDLLGSPASLEIDIEADDTDDDDAEDYAITSFHLEKFGARTERMTRLMAR